MRNALNELDTGRVSKQGSLGVRTRIDCRNRRWLHDTLISLSFIFTAKISCKRALNGIISGLEQRIWIY